jgi:hypothetical protein
LKPALKPLPTEPFDLSEWTRARVNINYHVTFDANLYDANLYSVPYNLVHEQVEIRSTPTSVEIQHKGARVASHLRVAQQWSSCPGAAATSQRGEEARWLEKVARGSADLCFRWAGADARHG